MLIGVIIDMIKGMIPPITDPLGQYWDQPPLIDVAVYNDIAIIEKHTLDQLAEYSTTIPTGAYEGKMWKRRVCEFKNGSKWLLCWYGPSNNPKKVSINTRPLRILRGD